MRNSAIAFLLISHLKLEMNVLIRKQVKSDVVSDEYRVCSTCIILCFARCILILLYQLLNCVHVLIQILNSKINKKKEQISRDFLIMPRIITQDYPVRNCYDNQGRLNTGNSTPILIRFIISILLFIERKKFSGSDCD